MPTKLLKRRGRPKKNDAKRAKFSVRLSDSELKMLVFLMEELNLTAAEVFRHALKWDYEDHSFL